MKNRTPTIRIARKTETRNERLALHEDRVRFHSGREAIHWKVDYTREGVGIVPVLSDGRVLLGLHYRYCPERWGWEIAAGGVEPDEDHLAAAVRELEEETGCRAGKIDFILDYFPAPGLGNEHFFIYFASELEQTHEPVDAEEIYELRAFRWEEIEDLISKGAIVDGFTLTALMLARIRGLA